MDYWSQIVFQETSFFAGPKTSQHENRFAHAGFAHVDAFVGAGNAEPVGAGLLQDLGNLRAAVAVAIALDRKSTRLNSSHQIISYAVFCLKKKKIKSRTIYI